MIKVCKTTEEVKIYRSNRLALVIKTKNPAALQSRLKNLLPNDYFEYLQTYDLKYAKMEDWFNNVVRFDTGLNSLYTRVVERE